MKSIYLKSGYLNQKYIEETADKNNINFIIEIGGRQVGKTYGVLDLMLEEKKQFILMRRTQTETDFICNDINNPFTVHTGHSITVKRDTKYTARISEEHEDLSEFIGSVMALSTIAKIRGFNGSIYSDVVFDEFIPENHVTKIRDEGDAFLNAIITISGNREIDGLKPLRVWLLANANTIASPILQALNIQNKVVEMMNLGRELSVLPERGIMILLPHSEEIMKKRKKTALLKAVGGKESRFEKMAFNNEFSYNDASNIASLNLKEFKPVFSLNNHFTVYRSKGQAKLYVTKYRPAPVTFTDTERDISHMLKTYPNLRPLYLKGVIWFSDLVTKSDFVDIIL